MANATAWLTAATHATAADWAARVVVNGGAAPSDNTVAAISNFCGALDAAAITSYMIAASVFAPDNLIASITPLFKVYGNDPWTNTNFVAADLSVQGLKGNGVDKYLNTGVNPTSAFANNTDGGLSVYNTFADYTAATYEIGQVTGANNFALQSGVLGQAIFDCFTTTLGRTLSNTPLVYGLGFTSGNRPLSSTANIYAANSSNAFASIGSVATASGSVPVDLVYVFARDNVGAAAGFSKKRLSFAAIHHGLSSAQCQALYNAVQQMRQSMGGGWV